MVTTILDICQWKFDWYSCS